MRGIGESCTLKELLAFLSSILSIINFMNALFFPFLCVFLNL